MTLKEIEFDISSLTRTKMKHKNKINTNTSYNLRLALQKKNPFKKYLEDTSQRKML